ncbi:LPXTG-site transpeptidase (sortase) family protein [Arthrobacter sp. CAN_A212]|uniref:class F sortase n=1 Tax=unclassified Arthrobacter TaxID=235627 RepID=UPI0018C9FADC|nr:class F sortase [Arthrobacter sp. CAN_C5]MBP2215584.1 LPXTG-site transpeptidase (sortase) family protein [Arthrobacter sp. CAN_C5]
MAAPIHTGITVTGRRRRAARWTGLALSAALIVTVSSVAGAASSAPATFERQAVAVAYAPAQPAAPEPIVTPPASDATPAASPPGWLTVEAAGIDQSILPLTPSSEDFASQSIVPPLTEDAYWLTSFGSPGSGSEDTTYLTGHSWEGKDAPFNRLSTDAEVGDSIQLTTETGVLDYVIDSITTLDKDTLKDSEIWDIVPNRLVVISCYTEDIWGKNVVITATPEE